MKCEEKQEKIFQRREREVSVVERRNLSKKKEREKCRKNIHFSDFDSAKTQQKSREEEK